MAVVWGRVIASRRHSWARLSPMSSDFPSLIATVLDAEHSVELPRFAHEFHRLSYRPQPGPEDDPLVVLADPAGHPLCLIRPPDQD